MKGRAPEPFLTTASTSKRVKHTNKEVTTMKMKIERKRRERVESQDDRSFLVLKVFYGHMWYIFYGRVKQKSREISFYFIKSHHNIPGSLIQEPSSIEQQSNPEQSQPMGRQQSHNQTANHRQKWIRSPAKSLSIREQSYPIQVGRFRNQENQFQYSAKKQHHPAALIRLSNLLLKSQPVQEQSQSLGRHQSHKYATSHQEKWLQSSPAKSLCIREQSYPIQEGSFQIQENRFQDSVTRQHHAVALIQLCNHLPKSLHIQEQNQLLERHQSQNQSAGHREKWTFESGKWWTFFPHYSHPPYRAVITNKKEDKTTVVVG
jgi:hypothetical protein